MAGSALSPTKGRCRRRGDEVPEKYLYKRCDSEDVPLMETPVIDLGLLLSSSSPSIRQEETDKLQSALSTWGCFQLINHGMTSSFLDETREVATQFFGLPPAEKRRYSRTEFEGYGHDEKDNWNDRLQLTVYPQHRRQLQYWPENPQKFSEILDKFGEMSVKIVEVLLKAMATSLGLEENSFLSKYGEEGLMLARFNYYPKCPTPHQVLGLRPHSDGTAITILLQDKEVEGLQVKKDDQWFRVPVIPHALFINVGDLMEIMSNGIFKSAVHKVTTNSAKDRMSVAVLCICDPHKEVGPATELITGGRPRRYKTVKDYGKLFFLLDPTGEIRPIDTVKI
ncbi:hypothetical protein Nepgr_020823 [Nepenthes gracilis]|uniref:Fe2OG dioxygenase domain-containing protein n=1 Tax=Nepenthes gracilis TaxID=150966 RepID=A0AAD3SXM8_NEPGR|nr:hypothetical protein Nepgr_020823 [Nepenthes gracilis]